MTIQDKYIILTGAASGIGRELAILLQKQGAHLFLVDRNQEKLADIAEQTQARSFACDLSKQESTDRIFQEALSAWPQIDIYIANAGFAYYEHLKNADWDHIQTIHQVNVFAPMYSALKMREHAQDRDYKVVIVSSAMAHMAVPGYSLYAGSKAALHRWADAYRFDLQRPNQLMMVYPIATRTNFFDSAGKKVPVAFPSQPATHVAKKIINGIQRDKKSVYTSWLFKLTIITNRIFPVVKPLYQWLENKKFLAWKNR